MWKLWVFIWASESPRALNKTDVWATNLKILLCYGIGLQSVLNFVIRFNNYQPQSILTRQLFNIHA